MRHCGPVVSIRSRHLFVQRAQGSRLFELDLRAEHTEPEHGFVAEAQYFSQDLGALGWIDRIVRWFSSDTSETSGSLRLLPPFAADGRDVHGYFAGERPPVLDGIDDPLGSVRIARGTIVALHPRSRGDEVVLRDYWACDAPAWRMTDMVDFGLSLKKGPPIAVCCAQSPLVIADEGEGVFDDELRVLDPYAMEKCELDRVSFAGRSVKRCELLVGDTVEVLGVVWDPERCRSRFDVMGRGGPFRSASVEPIRLVLGDERGTRMVIRKVAAR